MPSVCLGMIQATPLHNSLNFQWKWLEMVDAPAYGKLDCKVDCQGMVLMVLSGHLFQ